MGITKRILRTPEAAEYLGLAASTLEKKRLTGDGPEFVKLTSRAVGYDIRALDAWLDTQCRSSTSDSGQGSGRSGHTSDPPGRCGDDKI